MIEPPDFPRRSGRPALALTIMLALFWPCAALAQTPAAHDSAASNMPAAILGTVVKGVVMDANTRETLPMATIQVEGTFKGTVANADGRFELDVEALPAVLMIRYLGYRSVRLPVGSPLPDPLEILMEPSVMELPELVVTGEDPAVSIMERVIARKQLWRPGLFNYKARAYSRLQLGSDSAIVMIAESVNEVYWDRKLGTREVLMGYDNTSNIDEGIIPLGVGALPNFYDDDIEVLSYDVVGVTHPDALDYYTFKLLEYDQVDDRLIYRIGVEPRRRLQPTFEGEVFVLDGDFALLEVRLRPGESIFFPPPAQEVSFTYIQQFSNYGGDVWLPVDSRVEGALKIGLPGLQFPEIQVRQIARVSDYEINTIIPREVLEQERSVVVDSVSVVRSRIAGFGAERVPLTDREAEAYERIDSTMTLDKAFQPTGFLAKAIRLEEEGESRPDSAGTGLGRLLERVPGRLRPLAGADWVNGISLGAEYSVPAGESVRLGGRAAYAFHSDDWSVGAWASHERDGLGEGRLRFRGEWFDEWAGRHEFAHFPKWAPSLVYLAGLEDPQDMYRRSGWALDAAAARNGVRAGIGVSIEENASISPDGLIAYSFTGNRTLPSLPNPVIDEGRLTRVTASVGFQEGGSSRIADPSSSALPGLRGTNRAGAQWEWGVDSFGGEIQYARMQVDAELSLNTFYSRRFFPNTLSVEAAAGFSIGDLPVQRRFTIEPSLLSVAPFGVLKTLAGRPYEGDRFWRIHAEHDFKSIPFELAGWMWPSRKGIGLVVFANAAHSWIQSPAAPDLDPLHGFRSSGGVHAEVGVSVNGLFSILRLDAAWRLDARGFALTGGVARYF